MIKNIMFDLDGVLVEAQNWHFVALNNALEDVAGIKIGDGEHKSTFNGLPTHSKLNLLVNDKRIRANQIPAIWKLKQHHTMNLIKAHCRPIPQKIDMMHKLSKYRKACVTNSIAKTAYEMLVHSGLNYYLDYIQSNEATKFPKPSPAPYLLAMANMNITPNETLIIEDSEKGLTSAYLSGAAAANLQYNDVCFDRISEVISKIDQRNSE